MHNRAILYRILNQQGIIFTGTANNKGIKVHGPALEDFLCNFYNMIDLTDIMVAAKTKTNKKFWVETDIHTNDMIYSSMRKGRLITRIQRYDSLSLNNYEIAWFLAISNSIGGLIGYPGYEFPTTPEHLREKIVSYARDYIIGSKEQLARYHKYDDKEVSATADIFKR